MSKSTCRPATVITAVLSVAAASASAQQQPPEVVYADTYGAGYNTTDATAALQAAIDSGAGTVIVRNMGTPWNVQPINLASNQKIVFEAGTVLSAIRGGFQAENDRLLNAVGVSNVEIVGNGATLKMWKSDYQDPTKYTNSQHRHALLIANGSTNITATGLTITGSGGDGVYIGGGSSVPVQNVTLRDLVVEDNYRQGISITNAANVLVERSAFRTTDGHEPKAGIDLEPNQPANQLTNIVFRDIELTGNAGYGIQIYTLAPSPTSTPMSVLFEDIDITGPKGIWAFTGGDESPNPLSTFTFRDVRVHDTTDHGLRISHNSSAKTKLIFDRLLLEDVATAGGNPILIDYHYRQNPIPAHTVNRPGGLEFIDAQVIDALDRAAIRFADEDQKGLWKVYGSIYVDNPYGAWGELGTNLNDVTLQIIHGLVPVPEPHMAYLLAALLLGRRRRPSRTAA